LSNDPFLFSTSSRVSSAASSQINRKAWAAIILSSSAHPTLVFMLQALQSNHQTYRQTDLSQALRLDYLISKARTYLNKCLKRQTIQTLYTAVAPIPDNPSCNVASNKAKPQKNQNSALKPQAFDSN
jgi:hypothetical protein